ncbi:MULTISPECIES: PBP1A family penicillin-binding protein [unclassified Paenibacillus]|uniref:transglycosylase domain-containing protein n=1 Tax=unclassified Paenibacillus TaxID=185978 RepID=UPI000955A538|nr:MULTISPECIES: PBP1A family penicillin-binding protein [unclassified Paenibacillus]ASS67833.1 PBP1A family penicillin-binding protein [Paenibacillus sp. RUD330]SIR59738.1 penicillin-binding protein, 1A family [Paenibacillus sp. RU4X]SIR68551.1 penicillin-binding protein, 1A family [Paenibacillus sp. RU4T]
MSNSLRPRRRLSRGRGNSVLPRLSALAAGRPLRLLGLLAGTAMSLGLLALSILLLSLRLQSLPASSAVQLTEIYDASGQLMDSFRAGQSRESVPLRRISPYLVQATLAIEDHRFYKHGGFDVKGMARAAAVNLESGRARQGASTITQQLARNLYLTHERTWKRKLKEAMYTAQLEMNYSKDEILGMYLNQIYYGHGAYGIGKAARMYFGKSAAELTLAESAMLAGVPKGPKYYSPYMDMDNAVRRQRLILKAMQDGGDITAEQAAAARAQQLALRPLEPAGTGGAAPYFRDYVRQTAVDQLGLDEHLISEGGVRIYTTLDPAAQKAAEQAIRASIPGSSQQQAALVAIDPRTGYIKAMVGGLDYRSGPFNRALARRQPGSSFKPVLYLAALQSGLTAVTPFTSAPTVFAYDEGRKSYAPRNYNDRYAGGPISMRDAIASSDNTYAVNTIMQVGADKVIAAARALGLSSPMQPVPSLALGTFPVSPLEMASAFGTLAAGGLRAEPVSILRIEDSKGETLYEAHPRLSRAAAAPYAYVLTSLMESVFETGGTGSRVSGMIRRPVAGKTGTTASDAWLVGYTPELATAVWTGYDKNRRLTYSEAHRAAPIFASFTEKALEGVTPKPFIVPDGVVSVAVDPATGLKAAAGCSGWRMELFVSGTEPRGFCREAAPSGSDGLPKPEPQGQPAAKGWLEGIRRWWRR